MPLDWLQEFLIVASAHLLAVMSPGPDFAMVLKSSLSSTRREAITLSMGIAAGIMIHVTYCLLGVAYFMQKSPAVFHVVKVLGGVYLIWIGISALLAAFRKSQLTGAHPVSLAKKGPRLHLLEAFGQGFVTNVLNPKATMFFLSLFSQVVSPESPTWLKFLYGGEMTIATFIWFGSLSYLLTRPGWHQKFMKTQRQINGVMGVLLLGLGLRVVLL